MTRPRTASKEYRAAWRSRNREHYNEMARRWRAKNKARLSAYTRERRSGIKHLIPEPLSEVVAFTIAWCGKEYDPVACPLRFRSGLIDKCKSCLVFKNAEKGHIQESCGYDAPADAGFGGC